MALLLVRAGGSSMIGLGEWVILKRPFRRKRLVRVIQIHVDSKGTKYLCKLSDFDLKYFTTKQLKEID